jgi:hypothetical protein
MKVCTVLYSKYGRRRLISKRKLLPIHHRVAEIDECFHSLIRRVFIFPSSSTSIGTVQSVL